MTAVVRLTLAFLCVVGWSVSPAVGADDPPEAQAEQALLDFLSALAAKDPKRAYEHVAPDTKKKGEANFTPRIPLDYKTFVDEVNGRPAAKFGAFKFGKKRADGKDTWRIWVHFDDGDNDETLIVKVGDRWYVADPIHIIR